VQALLSRAPTVRRKRRACSHFTFRAGPSQLITSTRPCAPHRTATCRKIHSVPGLRVAGGARKRRRRGSEAALQSPLRSEVPWRQARSAPRTLEGLPPSGRAIAAGGRITLEHVRPRDRSRAESGGESGGRSQKTKKRSFLQTRARVGGPGGRRRSPHGRGHDSRAPESRFGTGQGRTEPPSLDDFMIFMA